MAIFGSLSYLHKWSTKSCPLFVQSQCLTSLQIHVVIMKKCNKTRAKIFRKKYLRNFSIVTGAQKLVVLSDMCL
jgi:hypothetical protein